MQPRVQSPESRVKQPAPSHPPSPEARAHTRARPMHPTSTAQGAATKAQKHAGSQNVLEARVQRPPKHKLCVYCCKAAALKGPQHQPKRFSSHTSRRSGPNPRRLPGDSGGGTAKLMPSAGCARPLPPAPPKAGSAHHKHTRAQGLPMPATPRCSTARKPPQTQTARPPGAHVKHGAAPYHAVHCSTGAS
jgi:hypothetical protein